MDYDINLNRAVLISPLLKTTLPADDARFSLVGPMTMLPSQAAIAAAHRRNALPSDPKQLPQAMAGVEEFVFGEHVGGLARLGRATQAESDALFAKVGGLIGLDPKLVAQQHGRVSAEVFVKSLLRERNQILDRYDGRQASDDPLPEHAEFASLDKTLTALNGVLSAPYFDYLNRTLGYRSDRRYILLNLRANARQRLYFGVYPGGHMFYLNADSRAELFKDVAAFYP